LLPLRWIHLDLTAGHQLLIGQRGNRVVGWWIVGCRVQGDAEVVDEGLVQILPGDRGPAEARRFGEAIAMALGE
jgi:hypothetical protein